MYSPPPLQKSHNIGLLLDLLCSHVALGSIIFLSMSLLYPPFAVCESAECDVSEILVTKIQPYESLEHALAKPCFLPLIRGTGLIYISIWQPRTH